MEDRTIQQDTGGEEKEGQPFRADLLRDLILGLVRRRGLEPLCLAALAPQASASANFATSAWFLTQFRGAGVTDNPMGSIASGLRCLQAYGRAVSGV